MAQILIIHGGDSFSSYEAYLSSLKNTDIDYERLKPRQKWRQSLAEKLTDEDVLLPTFPNSANAVYEEWKIYFEKLIPFFGDDVRLIGHSLGAMFLAKYLHTNRLATPVRQLILIAGQHGSSGADVGSFLVEDASNATYSAEQIHLVYSKDDPVVDFSNLDKFRRDLPAARAHIFEDRGHFLDETFPELIAILKQN